MTGEKSEATSGTEVPSLHTTVPRIYASGFSLLATGTDLKVILTDIVPDRPDGNSFTHAQSVNGVLCISFHSAKDLANLLLSVVGEFEREFGEVSTPYLKGQKASKE